MKRFALLILTFALVSCSWAQQYTRGIGVYPGDPSEYTGPTFVVDGSYRNLALHRPAYQSSAYDYNLTAQLITDGINEQTPPQYVVTSTSSAGILPKQQREVFLDGNITSSIDVTGDHPWVEFDLEGGANPPELDRIDLWLRRMNSKLPATGWTYVISGSDDHTHWTEVGRSTGTDWPSMHFSGPSFMQSIPFTAPAHNRDYRVEFSADGIKTWGVAELATFDQGREVHVAGPEHFMSAWMSALPTDPSGPEWVYVDLGATCTFDRIVLAWILRAAEGSIQVSDDATNWQTLQPLPANPSGPTEDIHLNSPASGRYVRILMTKPTQAGDPYILSELEVYGRGGPVPVAHPATQPAADGSLQLTGGAWKLQRASLLSASGEQISAPGFSANDWMIATVPGTALTSYLNDGAIADPDFGDNQYAVSDSFFCADFWYRDEFVAPALAPGHHLWLNFDGINWKAEVYLNGQHLGRIDGGMMRGRFDVTSLIHPGAQNALAVRVIANANPGSTKDKAGRTVNGGALGRDNPTFHAAAGWDWISTIRGRDDGIWNNVSLTTTGPVTVESPLVSTTLPLPDTTHADVIAEATLHNQDAQPISGTLRVNFGDVQVEVPVSLAGSETKTVQLTPATQPALHLTNPKLWWPVGYGDPNLYPVTIAFASNGAVSDSKSFQAGVREFTYSEDGGILKMWINGRRFIARGGNWGFSESMLRYRAREYETAMRYHRDLHFDMIRNWVGMTDDEAFYDAADRNGVVIWQDFWLANPWDGPNPDDNDLFLTNAKDYLLRIRNHASLGLFCGRNEGFPPQPVDDGLRSLVASLEPNS
ncbi:MAG: discoidin domain-containing protein, partial [Acidobacteriaceae bacterium]